MFKAKCVKTETLEFLIESFLRVCRVLTSYYSVNFSTFHADDVLTDHEGDEEPVAAARKKDKSGKNRTRQTFRRKQKDSSAEILGKLHLLMTWKA